MEIVYEHNGLVCLGSLKAGELFYRNSAGTRTCNDQPGVMIVLHPHSRLNAFRNTRTAVVAMYINSGRIQTLEGDLPVTKLEGKLYVKEV